MKTLLQMVFAAAIALLITGLSLARAQEIPEGFFLPPINPTGATLVTQELSPGVYALLFSSGTAASVSSSVAPRVTAFCTETINPLR